MQAARSSAPLVERYLQFVLSAVTPDGRCHNRLGLDGTWQDEPDLGDWWGRAVWSLGVAATVGPADGRDRALRAFDRLAGRRSPWRRSMAYAALGAADVCSVSPTAVQLLSASAKAVAARARSAEPPAAWPWPEPRLSYDNARVPEALLAAGEGLGRPDLVAAGLELLRFLISTETAGSRFSVTPTTGRGPGEVGPAYDQQPLELAAIADACARAWRLTRDPTWLESLQRAWAWFTGDNDAGVAMYDEESGAGYDGLTPTGRNENRGAESTIAALGTLIQARAGGRDDDSNRYPT